nr:RNA-directed DNA polymerase, eukaryota [Tanacetum cinerariifolium]
LDQGGYNDETFNERSTLTKDLHDLKSLEALEIAQKDNVRWSIEGGESTKYFHDIFLVTMVSDALPTNPRGEWDVSNIKTLVHVLKCFFLASGLKINLHKSMLMGIGINSREVECAARLVGCSTFTTPFNYLGVKVGDIMSRIKSWDEVISKLSSRLSKWKLRTLSVGGRLTLLK